MTTPSYPVSIAIKGSGGRKVKQDRNIRSARQRRKAFTTAAIALQRRFERAHGVTVDIASDHFWEAKEIDPIFAKLHAGIVALRVKYLGG